MSGEQPTDMSEISHWSFRIEDPAGRVFTVSVDAALLAVAFPDERSVLLDEVGIGVDHLISVRDRERKAELEANPPPFRDVQGY